jgi:hypothetical protein
MPRRLLKKWSKPLSDGYGASLTNKKPGLMPGFFMPLGDVRW